MNPLDDRIARKACTGSGTPLSRPTAHRACAHQKVENSYRYPGEAPTAGLVQVKFCSGFCAIFFEPAPSAIDQRQVFLVSEMSHVGGKPPPGFRNTNNSLLPRDRCRINRSAAYTISCYPLDLLPRDIRTRIAQRGQIQRMTGEQVTEAVKFHQIGLHTVCASRTPWLQT